MTNDELRASTQRILFVDAEVAVRRAFCTMVEELQVCVDTVCDAEEMYHYILIQPYDVIVASPDCLAKRAGGDISKALLQIPQTTIVLLAATNSGPSIDVLSHNPRIIGTINKPWDDGHARAITRSALAVAASRGQEVATQIPMEAIRLLLLEDSAPDAQLIVEYLSFSEETVQVTWKKNLSQAKQALVGETFDIILSDLTLPDARGLDALIQLRRISSDTAIIILSGIEDESLAKQVVQLGAQDYVCKNRLDPASLLRTITYGLERKRAGEWISRRAHFDGLTGVANRQTFHEQLEARLATARHALQSRRTRLQWRNKPTR